MIRPCTCDRCHRCKLFHTDDAYNRHWGGPGLVPRPPLPLPCIHLGSATGEIKPCTSCPGSVGIKLFNCAKFISCTLAKKVPNVPCCEGCQAYTPLSAVSNVRIEPKTSGRCFNGSIAEWNGKTYHAYRRWWDRARVYVTELGPDWQPIGETKQLTLGKLSEDSSAQEDPRLFVHRDRLCLSYGGTAFRGGKLHVSVCAAVLDENLEVEDCWYPHMENRQEWEKNWGFFDSDGDLYAVHSIRPHRVLLMTQRHSWEIPIEEKNRVQLPESLGILRGGASPILHNGEFYSFFHGVTKPGHGIYWIGLYTFEPVYPFRPKRFIRSPLLWPDPAEKPGPHVANVVFPGGAVYRNDQWHVAYGYYDRETRVVSWNGEDIEKLLENV